MKFGSLAIVNGNEYLEFNRNHSGIEFSNSAFSSKCIILIKVPEKIKEHKLKYLYNPYHLFRMLNVGGLVTGKINALLSLLIFFYSKDSDEYKYHYLIKKALFTEK